MLVIAHRGNHAEHNENTLAAFEAAVKLDVDGIETDVRISSDDYLVLIHDRIISGREVCALTRKEIEHETGYQVSTLDEAVKANGLNYNRQQYGDVIKNFMGFDALFAKDPRQALETLAKQANINLDSFNNKAVQSDEEDYRLPVTVYISLHSCSLENTRTKCFSLENDADNTNEISVLAVTH